MRHGRLHDGVGRTIGFKSVDGAAGTRVVEFKLSDGDGGTSEAKAVTVVVT